jgi:hypothetical protein
MTRFYEASSPSYWSRREQGRSASKFRAKQY